MRNSLKKLTLGVIALGAFSLTACMNSGSAVGPESGDNATIFVTTKMKNINTLSKPGLAKLTPIELTTLRITAVSDIAGPRILGEDSVVVEFNAGDVVGEGPGTFLDDATEDQEFNVKFSLRPLRSWTITVETIDDEDSVIQSGTASLGILYAGEVKGLSVTADANYNNYEATFNFEDHITSTSGSVDEQDLKITSFAMTIQSETAFGVPAGAATEVVPNVDHKLSIYKVKTALATSTTDSVSLKVYGYLPQGPDSGGTLLDPILLYSGAAALNDLSGTSATTVTLDWVGPVTGTVDDLEITISKVGTIQIDAVTDPEIID